MKATTSPALQDYKDGVNKRMAERFTEQVIWMKAHGVVTVKIDYDGSGDSGQMGDLVLLDKDDKPVEHSEGLFQAMADMFEKMAEQHGHDWWNNDGGYGEMTWDLETNTFEWSHSQRISNTKDYQYGEAELIAALEFNKGGTRIVPEDADDAFWDCEAIKLNLMRSQWFWNYVRRSRANYIGYAGLTELGFRADQWTQARGRDLINACARTYDARHGRPR